MRNLVLISLHVPDAAESLPLGAASVAAAVHADPELRDRVRANLLEASADEDPARLAARIRELDPDWIGFSVYSWNRPACARLAKILRHEHPKALFFAGGPEAGAEPEGVLAELSLDFLIRGEGEGPLPPVLRRLEASDSEGRSLPAGLAAIPGLLLPNQAPAPLGKALPAASLPSPWLSGILEPRGRSVLLWELSRGCPFACAYCYEGKGDRSVRHLPLERLSAELELFAASGAPEIFVLDPTFNADPARALDLLGLFRRRAPRLRWRFEIRAELLNRAQARAFALLDCSVQIGLQSARPEVLAGIGRPGFDPQRFARQLRLLDEEGVRFGLDLIYGLPGDDLSGFRSSLDYALGLGPNHLDVFPLAVLPGTELADRAVELGLEVEPGAPHLLLSAPGWSREELAAAGGLARACDFFYTKGRAVPWFAAALRPLRRKPSELLRRFAESDLMSPNLEMSHREIEARQLRFLEAEYRGAGLEALLPALRGLVTVNGAWSRAFAEGEATELELAYDPEELLGPAALDLRAFARHAPRGRFAVRVVPSAEGPRLEARPPGTDSRRGSEPGRRDRG